MYTHTYIHTITHMYTNNTQNPSMQSVSYINTKCIKLYIICRPCYGCMPKQHEHLVILETEGMTGYMYNITRKILQTWLHNNTSFRGYKFRGLSKTLFCKQNTHG